MNKLLEVYTRFILNTNPSNSWKSTRLVIHWLTLPIKLIVIGGLGIYQIIKQRFFTKNSSLTQNSPVELKTRQIYLKETLRWLPRYNNHVYDLYVNRVPYYSSPDGENHNTDHQCARQGIFVFLMRRLGLVTEQMELALQQHIKGKYLLRGYKATETKLEYNARSTSGDMLLGLCLGMLDTKDEMLKENFDVLLQSIILNDYALLEGQEPKDEIPKKLWNDLLQKNNQRAEKISMKSSRAMWQPGLETVGAQALTVLAALKVGDKMLRSREYKNEYNKLFWSYGYGILSLFPTAFIGSKRGYFNDHNCITALYILSKLSDSKIEKFIFKIAMLYTWALSYKWYNGYFTGLVEDAFPNTINPNYIETCKAYFYQNILSFSSQTGKKYETPKEYPVKLTDMEQGEFFPDETPKIRLEPNLKDITKTGLGSLAVIVMLEKNPKGLLLNE